LSVLLSKGEVVRSLSILGAGGHAKVVIDSLEQSLESSQIKILEEGCETSRKLLELYPVESFHDWSYIDEYCHIAIGSNEARANLGKDAEIYGKKLVTIAHRFALISEHARLESGVFVAANAIVAPEVVIKTGCIVNHASVVDHDCSVGEYSHIAPGAILGGGVNVGKQCLIGAGSVVLPGLSIGDGAIVGAGSVVTKSISENEKVVGNPAKRI